MAPVRPTTAAASSRDEIDLQAELNDAYQAPAIPRSLLKRIDAGIAAEWGTSPATAPASTTLSGGKLRRLMQSRSLVAVAAIVLMCGLYVLNSPGSSLWAATLRAMAAQGLIELQADDSVRWMSLEEGLVGERDAEQSRLLDVRQRVLLTRRSGESEIYRQPLPAQTGQLDEETIAVAFFAGLDSVAGDAGAASAWSVTEQAADPESSELNVRLKLERPGAAPISLTLRIDPETHLPTRTRVDGGINAAVSYPRMSPQRVRSREFPAGLQVVEGPPPARDGRSSPENVQIAAATSTSRQVVDPIAGPTPPQPQPPAAHALAAAPSTWAPVAAVGGKADEFVTEINAQLERLWREREVTPAPQAEDAELLRRLYLDLAGRTPTVHEVRSYLKDADPRRYERLVERLLASPDHASHLATVWRSGLIPDGVDLTAFGGVEAFDKWLADQFAQGVSYDEIVRKLLLAEGRLAQSGPLLFYTAAKLDPEHLAARTSRVFLGVRLECAQCHDHPFEPWKQEDFWSLAAFFSRISRPKGELLAASRVMRVHDIDKGDVTLPDTETVVMPRFPNTDQPLDEQEATARRKELAAWVTDAKNPYFARATANRVWGMMFGRGIVDPVDDFGVRNPPVSTELLDLLAGRLVHSGFELRELFRGIALSDAYRLSSGAEEQDERRLETFAQMNVKMLSAEQVYDCITVATLLDSPMGDGGDGFNITRFNNADREAFLQQFRTPSARLTEYQGGIPQALTLMNGGLIQSATGERTSGLLQSLAAPFFSNDERIEILYLATLSRPPRADERELLADYIGADAAGEELHQGLSDLLWSLLNSAEFTMNH